MKRSGRTLTCPVCGRVLETRVNRYGVECWPGHRLAKWPTQQEAAMALWRENEYKPEGWRDWERECLNSYAPVEL